MEKWLRELIAKFEDSTIDEVLINGCRSAEFVRGLNKTLETSPFQDSNVSTMAVQDFCFAQGVRLDPIVPAAGGSLRDGEFRWHAMIAPAVIDGPLFSLRRHRFSSISLPDFDWEQIGLVKKLENIFSRRDPVLICGATGSGKSTLMTALLNKYSQSERVAILETTPEIPALHPTWIRFMARGKSIETGDEIPISMLLSESLRLRPDRIVVGEIRDQEAAVFFDCIATGHQGAISTIHASTNEEVKTRLMGSLLKAGYCEEYSRKLTGSIDNLWCVFMSRGSPPRVRSIEKLS